MPREIAHDLMQLLRTRGRVPSRELTAVLGISRPTLMRAVQSWERNVIVRGKARNTAYAARRTVRGNDDGLPLYQIDMQGHGERVGVLDPLYPQGSALEFEKPFEWPLADEMVDGWFDGLPYPLDDMRPQGFLGRNFARRHASILQVPEDPARWHDDDVLHALSVLGADTPGNYIIGRAAYQRYLDDTEDGDSFVADDDALLSYYLQQAQAALAYGVADSSAAGEFPKFAARRRIADEPMHVLVKFSGADDAPGTQRWSDLLVCEHLALRTVAEELGIASADSRILQAGGRTFLEVIRFDRHGARGRSAVCSWSAINAALVGAVGNWIDGAAILRQRGWLSAGHENAVQKTWHFGRLIANTDMHDGNLAFRPGLALAPVYDMLPMLYAPVRGVELPERQFQPSRPLPEDAEAWNAAASAACIFWQRAAEDPRISDGFRRLCADNGAILGVRLG
jgi:hypothetical protein